jgi:hypothetical protein
MNKLPWFKHDANAHEDLWIKQSIDRGGHFAGWAWWVLLEMLHRHGRENTLRCSATVLAHAMMTRKEKVIKTLTIFSRPPSDPRDHSKVIFKSSGDDLEIEILNFRKKQDNLRLKAYPNRVQPVTKMYEREITTKRGSAPRRATRARRPTAGRPVGWAPGYDADPEGNGFCRKCGALHFETATCI